MDGTPSLIVRTRITRADAASGCLGIQHWRSQWHAKDLLVVHTRLQVDRTQIKQSMANWSEAAQGDVVMAGRQR